jgi:hypothetical protein
VWTATVSVPWITLLATGGTGDGEVGYVVAANAGGARTGLVIIAGQVHIVQQEAAREVRVSLKGKIAGLSGGCPAIAFVLDGRRVVADAGTRFTDGACAALRNDVKADVEGEDRGSSVYAVTVDAKGK